MILITGGTGLLGSHVVVELLHRGEHVRVMYRSADRKQRVLDLLHYYYPGEIERIEKQLSWCQGDVLDLSDVEAALQGVDKVVHCAAKVSFFRRDFNELFEVNRQGTANMVNFSIAAGVQRFIHVSSTAAVGNDSHVNSKIKRETNGWNPNDKTSAYSLSKYSAEKEVWRGVEEGLPAAIVNPSVMYGPGSWDESSLQIFRTLDEGLKFYTRGSNAFVDVRDVADVIIRLLDADIVGERYLVTGHNLAFREMFTQICSVMKKPVPRFKAGPFLSGLAWRLAGLMGRLTGKRPTITKESARSALSDSAFSTEKLQKRFPDFQFHPFEETIQNTIAGRMNP